MGDERSGYEVGYMDWCPGCRADDKSFGPGVGDEVNSGIFGFSGGSSVYGEACLYWELQLRSVEPDISFRRRLLGIRRGMWWNTGVWCLGQDLVGRGSQDGSVGCEARQGEGGGKLGLGEDGGNLGHGESGGKPGLGESGEGSHQEAGRVPPCRHHQQTLRSREQKSPQRQSPSRWE